MAARRGTLKCVTALEFDLKSRDPSMYPTDPAASAEGPEAIASSASMFACNARESPDTAPIADRAKTWTRS
jgi:hypothetical protein